jgi:hypothetical protein
MANFQPKSLRRRALLADVLPFEVPIVFTNDFFFASTLKLSVGAQTENALRLLRNHNGFTVPFSYSIVKDRGRRTQLSIVHPIVQIRWAEFIDQYGETILTYCQKGEISLRHPFLIVAQHASAPLEPEATARDGLPHELLEEGVPDFSRMSSYFRLRRYNIVSKFLESRELIRLEKRYSHMISLDVSKCFYNIYTHSIAWAVKGKKFAKSELGAYSFEDTFDALMQAANYKETNGIVVGPEISRIFAEIIFQQIDKDVIELLDAEGWSRERYSINRYVDDYFIFANNTLDLEYIEDKLSSCLEHYKLYLNTDKRIVAQRPFVTPISRLKRDIADIVASVTKEIGNIKGEADFVEHRAVAKDIRRKLEELRLAVAPEEVGFHNVSGWLMWKLRKICADAMALLRSASDDQARDAASQIVAAIMELAFYVTALDCRVRTGFNLTLLLSQVVPQLDPGAVEQHDFVLNVVFEEFVDLIEIVLASRSIQSVEVGNLLLAGAHIFGGRFVKLKVVEEALAELAGKTGLYNCYVTAKFCYLKDRAHFSSELNRLNSTTERYILRSTSDPKVDTELYLLFCDLISAPDVDVAQRQRVIDHVLRKDQTAGRIGAISADAAGELSRLIGFVDWNGARLRHTLVRRQLRSAREY